MEGERTSPSGIPLKPFYRPEDAAGVDYERGLGDPGAPPYTRGPYPGGHRDQLWRIAQLMGSGRPDDVSSTFDVALEAGINWVVFEGDQITTCHMWDPDHPQVVARSDDVGFSGPALIGVPDFEHILAGVDLEKTYIHMGGLPWMNACVFVVAEQRGVPLDKLRGTGQGEMFIPYLSTPFKDMPPPRCYLDNNCDLIEFHTEHVPHVVPVSCSGHDVRANGIDAAQELAIVMAWNIDHIEEVRRRGRFTVDQFCHGLGGVNFSIGRDFFEEICKLRAARRMWTKLLTERYGVTDPKKMRMRIHGFTADRDYTREQPLVNIVRSAYRTVAAALGGVQSLGVGPYDEALAVPSDEALVMAIRTQQVIQHESGVANVADPLAGSYYVESLTDELEERAWAYLKRVEDAGGFVASMESGWLHREVYAAAVALEARYASGEMRLVGSNCFRMDDDALTVTPHRPAHAWDDAMERLESMRRRRDEAEVRRRLDALRDAVADPARNQMPEMIAAMRAYATIGEVGQVYRDHWGVWNPPLPF